MPLGPQWKAQVSSRASLDGRRLPIQLALPPGRLLGKWLKGRGASWAFSASASPSQGSSGNGVLWLRLLHQKTADRTGENSLPWRRPCESEETHQAQGSYPMGNLRNLCPLGWIPLRSCDWRARKSPPRSEPLPNPDSASSTSSILPPRGLGLEPSNQTLRFRGQKPVAFQWQGSSKDCPRRKPDQRATSHALASESTEAAGFFQLPVLVSMGQDDGHSFQRQQRNF